MTTLRIGRIILFAKDLGRLLAFYRDVVGMAVVPGSDDSEGFVSLDGGACSLSLHRIPEPYASQIEIRDPPVAREDTPIKFAFFCEDVATTRAELIGRGAAMGEVRTFGPVVLCDGVDPEGNVFQLSNRI